MSEGDDDQDVAPVEIPENRAATDAARATRQDSQKEKEQSGTTDEVSDIEVCEETTTAQASVPAAGTGERHIPGSSCQQ